MVNKSNRNKELINEIGQLAKIGGWEYNLKTNELYYTQEIYNILEADKYFKPSIEKAASYYIPEHRPVFEDAVKSIVENGIPYDLELLVITEKQNKKWVNVKGKAIFNKNGEISKIIGTFQDIHEKVSERLVLDKIISISTQLIGSDTNSFDYKILSDTILEISGAAYSAINLFDDSGSSFSTLSISAYDTKNLNKLRTYGIDISKTKWAYDENREKKIENKNITRFGSIRELTGKIIPKEIISKIEKDFKLGSVYLIKIIRNNNVIGDFTLFYNKGKEIENEKLVEIFTNQAALTIEKIKTEEALLHNELKQKQMISGISDVIAIIRDNEIIEYASPNILRIFGWSPAEITGKKFENFIHPKNSIKIKNAFISTINKSGDDSPIELDILCKNGQYKTTELNATNYLNDPVIKGILINFHDISKRKAIENEAIKLNQAVEHSSAAIIVTDPEANIEYVNPKFVERTGYSLNEVKGKNPRIIQSKQTPVEVYENLWNTIKSGKEWRGELLNKSKHGHLFWEMTSISSIKNENGEITNYVAVKENITGLKAQQEAIKEKNKMLEKINAEKDKFFSIIAHDLRSPFNSLLGLTEVMTQQLKSMTLVQIQQLAQSLNDSASNLYDLISNLLEWATLQRGRTDFEPVEIDIDNTINSCCDTLIDVARLKDISIEFSYDNSIKVWADRNMLKTILRNLVSNAIKFSPRRSKITLKVEKKIEGKIQFSISDHGIGMSKELLDNLFKIDKKTNRQGTENEPSTGLGLLLCRDLIEKHNGKIWAKSTEGKGTTFYFILYETSM
jgi:PAS domain S-box-containing protein